MLNLPFDAGCPLVKYFPLLWRESPQKAYIQPSARIGRAAALFVGSGWAMSTVFLAGGEFFLCRRHCKIAAPVL